MELAAYNLPGFLVQRLTAVDVKELVYGDGVAILSADTSSTHACTHTHTHTRTPSV